MTTDDEYFVSTCSHTNESSELDAAGQRRLAYIKSMQPKGLKIKTALLNDKLVGLIYLFPVEHDPWGMQGREIMTFPCLWVTMDNWKRGVGTALLIAAEDEARALKAKGIATIGFYWDFWFMAAGFFEANGYSVVRRQGTQALLWKVWDNLVEPPDFPQPQYYFQPQRGKVVVDLFYNTFCLTSDVEAQHVREVCAAFGDQVVLNEYPADNPAVLRRFYLPRAIFVNGDSAFWGYEAPREDLREAIQKAIESL
ncbi:MAG: GNAT family N-acetyltransferase [Calditrichaeota bacterium]|nr:GNAT family N-acetyltransferase [Calditrichota bacterium]